MSDDPLQPKTYDPAYDPHSPLPDVGSGPVFGAHLAVLYRAGVQLLPSAAAVLVGAARDLDAVAAPISRLGHGSGSAAVRDVLTALATAQDALVDTGRHTERAGEALVRIADGYVRTDAEARDRFDLLTVPEQLPERVPSVPFAPFEGPAPSAPRGVNPGMI
ncbi:hypothetical protein ABFT23_06665 [Nocardioides sp. C4-1]|uniref:WXG100 family type VII secretion target n=1 Tax=Nocardioides sp. C4-1 TaxID=3151851 RepID=UPI0032662317